MMRRDDGRVSRRHQNDFVEFHWSGVIGPLVFQSDDTSLSEGSTIDLRKPGEEEDEYSEMAEEAMDPENCFPDGGSLPL